jgi:hypothetical protein
MTGKLIAPKGGRPAWRCGFSGGVLSLPLPFRRKLAQREDREDDRNAFLFRESTETSRELVHGRSEMRAEIDLEDGQWPVKFKILPEDYLGGFRPSRAEACGAPSLLPQDAMAMKLIAMPNWPA